MSPDKNDSAQERLAVEKEKAGSCAGIGCGTVLVIISLGIILTNLSNGMMVAIWLFFLLLGIAVVIGVLKFGSK